MNTLAQRIADYDEMKQKQVPVGILQTMDNATKKLKAARLEEQCLASGDMTPDFTLPDVDGVPHTLSLMLHETPVVISFYRGGWCPYCNMELQALQESLPEILAEGCRLVVISPELREKSAETRKRNALSFTLLHDRGNAIATTFGLVFELAEELRPIYHNFGLDIPDYNGDYTYELPVPATYIISQEGRILAHFTDADYTKRMEPGQIAVELRKHRAQLKKGNSY